MLVAVWDLLFVLSDAVTLFLSVVLIWVVFSDLLYRRIGNWLVLGLLVPWGAGLAWSLCYGDAAVWSKGAVSGLLTAALVLLVGLGLFVVRWVGAGDVKLVAVLSLWFGDQALHFLLITSMTGGLLALVLPFLRVFELWLARAVLRLSQGLALYWPRLLVPVPVVLGNSAPQGIPYGLAIAAGAACILLRG